MTRPAVRPSASWSFGTPKHEILPGGVVLDSFPMPTQPLIFVRVILPTRLDLEPADKEGIASLTLAVSDEGTTPHPGDEIVEALERCGADYTGTVTRGATFCDLSVPVTRFEPAVALLAEIITMPQAASDDVARHISIRLASLEQESASPTTSAHRELTSRMVTGRDARPVAGRADTVLRLSAEDVRAYHDAWWHPATIICAGALPADTSEIVAAHFASAAPSLPARPQMAAAPPDRTITIVDFPSAVQSHILAGCLGVGRDDPSWPAMRVGAAVVGGSFGSRLNMSLREEHGYTYGAHAGFVPEGRQSTFTMGTSCRTDATAAALDEMLAQVRLETPITADETASARQYLTAGAPLRYESAAAVARQAAALATAGMKCSWVDEYRAAVDRVTAAEAQEAFVSATASPHIVIAGQAAAIAEDLEALGYPVRVVSP